MNELLTNSLPDLLRNLPGLRLFAICSLVLAVKMMILGGSTAAVRARLKVAVNKEDVGNSGATLSDVEHPEVARYLRAHRNDLENIPMFFAIGLVAILIGASPRGMQICFIVFTLARVTHTVVYLKSLQPWRTLSFAIGNLCTLALGIMSVIRAFG